MAAETPSLAVVAEVTRAPRGRTSRVWHGDAEAVPRAVAPLARAGAEARALRVPDDPELVRVRRLLADLRPDCADPWEPPVEELQPVQVIRVRDPMAGWGGIPRGVGDGLGAQLDAAAMMQATSAADVINELAGLSLDDEAVLLWLRAHGSLKDGLRALYYEAAIGIPSELTRDMLDAWANLDARRDGAPAHGRRVVLRAAAAWGR